MLNESVRWFLDVGLPTGPYLSIDALSAERITRTPGPAGLREASQLNRTLVTCDQEFRGSWALGIDHPGIVILNSSAGNAPYLERNLQHLEFIVTKLGRQAGLAGSRFLVQPDCEVKEILASGQEVEVEPWKAVVMQLPTTLAMVPQA